MGELLRNGRGRIRCYWHDPQECSDLGWASYWEYLIDEDGDIPLCWNHSDQARQEYIAELRERNRVRLGEPA